MLTPTKAIPSLVGVNTYQSSISFGRCQHQVLTQGVDTYQSEYHLGRCQHLVSTDNTGCQHLPKRKCRVATCLNFAPAQKHSTNIYKQFASFSVSACDSELFKQESKWLALVNRLVSAGLSHYQPVSEQLWAHLYCRADQIVSVCFRLEDTMLAELINFFPFFLYVASQPSLWRGQSTD